MRSAFAVGSFLLLLTVSPCAAQVCVGDCNGDGAVTINELVTIIAVDLGIVPTSACPASQCDCGVLLSQLPDICCTVQSVRNALDGCAATPSPMPTGTPSPAVGIPYTLTEGSIILSSPAPGGSSGTVLQEQLSGAFSIVVLDPYAHPGRCSNISPCIDVTDFRFTSMHFTVSGFAGEIDHNTLGSDDGFVSILLTGSINDQSIQLFGNGTLDLADADGPSPVFTGLQIICGVPSTSSPGDLVFTADVERCAGVQSGAIVGVALVLSVAPPDAPPP